LDAPRREPGNTNSTARFLADLPRLPEAEQQVVLQVLLLTQALDRARPLPISNLFPGYFYLLDHQWSLNLVIALHQQERRRS
jgi:hypothetical protein